MQTNAKPFFARFLETQDTVQTGVEAGCGVSVTLKYPSDFEDQGGGS